MTVDRLTLIPLLPLLGFLLNGLFGRRLGRGFVNVVGCGLPLLAFALAVGCFTRLDAAGGAPLVAHFYTWASVGGVPFEIDFWFDRLSAVMALIVTGVGSLIHVYSTGYMKDDPGYARFFAYLNLFLFFMLLLVLGRSLLVCFVGWEGVGLASYLLIGFWFDDAAKAAAGSKAFITNRIGDAGFLLGMFLLHHAFGSFDFDAIGGALAAGQVPATLPLDLAGLLLFLGATGKSAQLPLHVWLPDAMAGPTPVSALIHAATMVTAGVYLVARLHGLYALAPQASAVIATVGVATALFAATVALVQTDIKKVLAWSTISQLGYMFLALGVGAWGVAVFHLYTHAFFKACLFLGAGSVIHALGGEQDIRRMGGLARRIPLTFATFAVATAAIAGIPPLAGFFSKDEILWFAYASTSGGARLLWGVGAATALLTAFYMFRLLWLTFLGSSRAPTGSHPPHESPFSMTGVLIVLAVASALGGFVPLPHFLAPLLAEPAVRAGTEESERTLLLVSIAIAVAGLLVAATLYRRGPERADRIAAGIPRLHRLLTNRWYVDELYEHAIARPVRWLSGNVFLRLGDRWLIDGALDGSAALAQRVGGWFAALQTGSLQRYALYAAVGIAACVAWVWRHA